MRGKKVHCPGIEPGSQEWESCMIPLHQQCLAVETASNSRFGVIESPGHCITKSPGHCITKSPGHCITKSPGVAEPPAGGTCSSVSRLCWTLQAPFLCHTEPLQLSTVAQCRGCTAAGPALRKRDSQHKMIVLAKGWCMVPVKGEKVEVRLSCCCCEGDRR